MSSTAKSMADYGSDVYGQVEGPDDAPYSLVEFALAYECPDCLVNVFIERGDYPEGRPADWKWPGWHLRIAHDETCPWLKGLEESTDA